MHKLLSMTTAICTQPAVNFKGGMFTLSTLQLFSSDLKDVADALDAKIEQAPNFFLYAPVALDLKAIKENENLDLLALCHLLKSKKMIPVGIRGANKQLKALAQQMDLAQFPEEKETLRPKQNIAKEITQRAETAVQATPTRLITQPVRSGQQIYAQGGDLIVLSSVSHGAELLADGHIHVYGALRGRALAGIKGFQDAMIFCKHLEAELISIAGQYRLSEDLKETCWKESCCVQLQAGRLHIRSV